jgi:hypothetical protein
MNLWQIQDVKTLSKIEYRHSYTFTVKVIQDQGLLRFFVNNSPKTLLFLRSRFNQILGKNDN